MRNETKEVTLRLSYAVGTQDIVAGHFAGGVERPSHIDELLVDLSDDPIWDEATQQEADSGKVQMHIRGSRLAYFEFARYLLALCEYSQDEGVHDPGYHSHFDEIHDSDGDVAVHLIVHAPDRERP